MRRTRSAAPVGRRAVLGGAAHFAAVATLLPAPLRAAPGDASPRTAKVRQTVSAGRTLALYLAVPPTGRGRHAALLVLHDAGGWGEAAQSVAREVAMLGYVGCAPDLLSRSGGTPPDAAAARARIMALDRAETLNDAAATLGWLARNPPGERVLTGRVGAIGLGPWGVALVQALARQAGPSLALAVAIGAAPDPALATTEVPWLSLDRADALDGAAARAFLDGHLR